MREDISKLLHLQSLDLRIRELGKIKEDRTLDLKRLEEKIGQGEQAVEQEKKKLQQEQTQLKTLELQVEEKRSRVEKYQQQQFSIKSNKEYQALQHEIEGLKADIRILEDKMLDFMEKAESEKSTRETFRKDLDRYRQQYRQETEAVQAEFALHDREIEQIGQRWQELAASLEAGILEKYERIFSRKPDRALVAVVGGVCQGCQMQLTAQITNDLKKEAAIHYCENCGRLIYLPE